MDPQTPLEKLNKNTACEIYCLRIRKTRLEFGFFLLATSWPRAHFLASYVLVSSNRWETKCLPHRLLKEPFEEKAIWKYPSHGYGCTKDPHFFSWLSINPCDKNWHFEQYNKEIFRHRINQGAKANRVLLRECTGHSKQPLPTTQEKALHMDITRSSTPKSDWLYSLQPKMEKLYTVSKNKTRSWLWLRSWTPYCQIQT